MSDSLKSREWNGKKRIAAAFNFERPDRVPRFDATISSEVASAVMGRDMLVGGGSLRFKEIVARFASEQAGKEFEEKILQDVADFYKEMGYDMVRLPWRDTRKATRRIDEFTYMFGDPDGDGPWEVYRYDPATFNWHVADSWLAGGHVEKLCAWLEKEREDYIGPDTDPSRFDTLKRFCSMVGEDLAVTATLSCLMIPMWEAAWLMAVEIAPELVGFALDRQMEEGLEDIELGAEIGLDMDLAGGDFCTKTGPVYSPETFDKLILPRLKRLTEKCDELGLRYVFRTDGYTWPVADSLLGKSGIHGYGEIDYGAGMRLGEIRESFPKITLFGNLDCGGALVSGTTEDVRCTVREIISETAGLGHVVGSSNEIMPETPLENYLAMIDEESNFQAV